MKKRSKPLTMLEKSKIFSKTDGNHSKSHVTFCTLFFQKRNLISLGHSRLKIEISKNLSPGPTSAGSALRVSEYGQGFGSFFTLCTDPSEKAT